MTLCTQLGVGVYKIEPSCPLYDHDGAPVTEDVDTAMESTFNRLLEESARLRTCLLHLKPHAIASRRWILR
jgi:hypothetical protein